MVEKCVHNRHPEHYVLSLHPVILCIGRKSACSYFVERTCSVPGLGAPNLLRQKSL